MNLIKIKDVEGADAWINPATITLIYKSVLVAGDFWTLKSGAGALIINEKTRDEVLKLIESWDQ